MGIEVEMLLVTLEANIGNYARDMPQPRRGASDQFQCSLDPRTERNTPDRGHIERDGSPSAEEAREK